MRAFCDNSTVMLDLTLIDAVAVLYVLYSIARARSRSLGDALHDLLALLLLIGLFLGFRAASEMRGVLNEAADMMRTVPGLGSKILIVVAAWYLLRLLRNRTGYWIEKALPTGSHRALLPLAEGLRALLLVGFIAWLAEGLFDPPPSPAPKIVEWVRAGDRLLDSTPHEQEHAPAAPPTWPMPPPAQPWPQPPR